MTNYKLCAIFAALMLLLGVNGAFGYDFDQVCYKTGESMVCGSLKNPNQRLCLSANGEEYQCIEFVPVKEVEDEDDSTTGDWSD
jgi:hypothetical protein